MEATFNNKKELKELTAGKALYICPAGTDGNIKISRTALNEFLKPRSFCKGDLYIEDWYAVIAFTDYEV